VEILIFEDGDPAVDLLEATDRARLVVSIANHEARQMCWPYIGS
jgi:hypothetical protein